MYEDELAIWIGKRVKNVRDYAGFTQMGLAVEASLAVQTIVLIETGNGNPKLETLARIARACGVSLQQLMFPELCQAAGQAIYTEYRRQERDRLIAENRRLTQQYHQWAEEHRSRRVAQAALLEK